MSNLNRRNVNIELLRIFCMYMVLVLHALNWSGALAYTTGIHFWVYWFVEGLAIIAVNVFMLISGYFQVNTTFKTKNVINIILEVWCYSVLFSGIMLITGGANPSIEEAAKMILPITTKRYWFVNSYLLVYLLSPFMNKVIKSISRRQYDALILILLMAFSVRVTALPMTWSQDSTGGMSVLWLGTLYMVGAWIRTTQRRFANNYWHGILYLLCALCLVVLKGLLLKIGVSAELSSKLYGYPSLIVFCEATMLFLFFIYGKPIQGIASKVICMIAKHSFSVYVVHFSVVSVLFTTVLKLNTLCNNVFAFVPWMLVGNAIVFGLCVGIDVLRERMFVIILNKPVVCRMFDKIDGVMNM